MVAAAGGFDDVVAYLLEKGADPRRQSRVRAWLSTRSERFSFVHPSIYSSTAMHRTNQCILSHDENQGGKSALHWAARHGERRACRVLLQAGADVSVPLFPSPPVYVWGGKACMC